MNKRIVKKTIVFGIIMLFIGINIPNLNNVARGEYTITLEGQAFDNGRISFDGTIYTLSYDPWGTNILVETGTHTISALPWCEYLFGYWTATGDLTVTNQYSQSTTVTVTGPGTLTVWFLSGPRLETSTTEIDFGTHSPSWTGSQTIDIWNRETGTLTYTLTENMDWITITPTSGSSTGEHNVHTITVTNTNEMLGYYDGDIEIQGECSNKYYIHVSIVLTNPPNQPIKPLGSKQGKINIDYTYSTSAIDPDGDQVYYLWDWGDGTQSDWLGPYDSGTEATANHIWTTKGNYIIKVKVKDIYELESIWSKALQIKIK